MKKKILVTGGAGFVGSNLCKKLIEDENNEVYSLDNYFTGSTNNHHDGVTYLKGDCENIERIINFKPDYIYHLGEYSRVEQSFEDVNTVWKFNKIGMLSILEFCRKNACKIIYAGSSTKFGDGGLGRSQSPYAWSKASNTELLVNYGNWFNVQFAIVYFYNVFGDNEISNGKYATLIGIFKEKLKNKKKLTVVSPGTQKRNFTHIDDIINGIIIVGKNGYGDDFGIGSDSSYSILEIAEMFGGDIEMLAERKGNRMTADVVSEKTKALGWKCRNDIVTYINKLKNENN